MHEPIGRLVSDWTVIDGLRRHTRRSIGVVPGGQTPVVLVHGLTVSSRYMVPTAVRLAPYRRVYAPDLPGFGKSAHPEDILNVPALADALVRWMDVYHLDQAVMLGNSLGCQIIAEIGLRYPERLTHAILTGPTMDPQARTMRQHAWRLLLDATREPVSSYLIEALDFLACGLRRTIGTLHYGLEDRIEDKLPHLRVPTLVVRGANDPIAPQRWVEQVTWLLPNGKLVIIPKAAHAVNYNSPTALVRTVRSFLEEHV